MGPEVAQQVVPPSVGFAAQGAAEGPDVFVALGDVTFQAVELGERLATSGSVFEDPQANLFLFGGDVSPLLLGQGPIGIAAVLGLGLLFNAVQEVGHPAARAPVQGRRLALLVARLVGLDVPVQVVFSPVILVTPENKILLC